MKPQKNNHYTYETESGIHKGYFNLYQGKSGHIFIQMATGIIKLSLDQINTSGIESGFFDLKDFSIEDYQKAYAIK